VLVISGVVVGVAAFGLSGLRESAIFFIAIQGTLRPFRRPVAGSALLRHRP